MVMFQRPRITGLRAAVVVPHTLRVSRVSKAPVTGDRYMAVDDFAAHWSELCGDTCGAHPPRSCSRGLLSL
jgi:hypothetical protein